MAGSVCNVWIVVGAIQLVLVIFPTFTVALAGIASVIGLAINPTTTVVTCWLLLWTVLVPQICFAHVGLRGYRILALFALYWLFTVATHRWERRFRVSDDGIVPWIRSSKFWKHLAAYFPATLQFEVPLPRDEGPYLFAMHPHGLWSAAVWSNIVPEVVEGVLPRRRICTLDVNFYIPIIRDILFAMGLMSSSKEAITECLSAGISVGVVVGGGREATMTAPGTLDLVLKKRRGFVKLAMRTGAHLVPVLTFGETALYEPSGATMIFDKMNKFLLRCLGASLPSLSGWAGTFLPHAHALHTVVGEPLKLQQTSDASDADIEKVHNEYCQHLVSLYAKYKDKFDQHRERELRIC